MHLIHKKTILLGLVALLLMLPRTAAARPVSYADGWMLMTMNDGYGDSLGLSYSPTAYYSIGYDLDYWREEEWLMNSARVNWLAKRWNEPDLQANFYLMGAFGVATSDFAEFEDETEPAGFVGMEFDAENRRYYVSYENRWTDAGVIDEFFQQKGRIGFAPYVAEYGALHTWIMLQVDHRPQEEDELVWTPMLRFFKGDVMLEVGVSDEADVMVNLSYQF